MALIPGTVIELGGVKYTVPPLSLGQLRNGGGLDLLKKHDQLVANSEGYEAFLVRGQTILLALQRNYPELSEDTLFEFLDLRNTTPFWQAILGLSGLTPGEDQAAVQTQNGT